MCLSISDSQVLGKIEHDTLKLFQQSLIALLDHEVGHLIQEADYIVVQLFGRLSVLLILPDQADEALQSGVRRVLGIFPQCLDERLLAGQVDLMVELALFLEQLVPFAGLDPLTDGDAGNSEDQRQFLRIGLAVQIGFPAVVPLDAELMAVTHTRGVPCASAGRG